jgi:hypothetical protein
MMEYEEDKCQLTTISSVRAQKQFLSQEISESSLVKINEEPLERKSSCSGLEN